MCGICGIAGLGSEEIIRRMTATMVHRGPDGEGYFVSDGISLGARRLSIIDLAGSDQPIFNEDRTVVTVYNGEIYNYRELRKSLEKKGHRLVTSGDTEVIVHLYEEYGAAAVHLLWGMFGFAIWDAGRRRLLLVRDRLGVKPLYYAEYDGKLLFGSEIKAILAFPGFPREIDAEALALYCTFGYVPGPRTLIRAIRKVPPGHQLLWEEGSYVIRQYWDVVFAEVESKISEQEAAEEFRWLIEEAVQLRLVSDVPIGALLSGGIDSSTVVGLMARSQRDPPRTFTVGFDVDGGYNEAHEAQAVASHFGTVHRELVMEPLIADLLPRLVWYQDEPVADPAAVPTYLICKFAAQSVKVVLTGEGGDELLGGYPRYAWLAASDSFRRSLLGGALAPVIRYLSGPLRGGSRIGQRLHAMAGQGPVSDVYLEWIAQADDATRQALIKRAGNGAPAEVPRALVRSLLAQVGSDDAIHFLMYVDFKTWLADDILTKMDRMSMAVSVEARVPFLDHRLVEFVAGLPRRLMVRHFGTKRLLRRVMREFLPGRTLRRPKQAFRVPIAGWLRGELRNFLQDTLLSSRSRQRGYLENSAISRLIAEHLSGHKDRAQILWSLLWLELWFRTFLDRESSDLACYAHPAAHR